MDHKEQGNAQAQCDASVTRPGSIDETCHAEGHYAVECYGPDGVLKWKDEIFNTVATVGKNDILDQYFAGSAYTAACFMGLVGSGSFSAIAAGDTMASHSGWQEAGGANAPTYSGSRKTCAFSAASAGAKALSSALSFGITGAGTVKGCFVVAGSGASATIDNTGGKLISAGLFSQGDKIVGSGDTVNVSWSFSI